jgi:lipid-binding SYLF domain-containing protein
VFPTIGKGGFGIGVAHGKGKVYVDGKVTGRSSITQVSVGAQVGGQAYSQIIFFEDKRAYDEFTSGNFEFSAQVSAVAITTGAQAQASTTGKSASANPGARDAGAQEAKYHKGMAVLVYAKGGFMYEASLGGQKYNFQPIKKSD